MIEREEPEKKRHTISLTNFCSDLGLNPDDVIDIFNDPDFILSDYEDEDGEGEGDFLIDYEELINWIYRHPERASKAGIPVGPWWGDNFRSDKPSK